MVRCSLRVVTGPVQSLNGMQIIITSQLRWLSILCERCWPGHLGYFLGLKKCTLYYVFNLFWDMSWFYFASRFQFPMTRERSLHPLGWKCYFTNHPSRCSHYRGLWKSVFLSRWLFQGLTFISGRWLVPYRKGLFEGGLFNIRTSWGIEILEDFRWFG